MSLSNLTVRTRQRRTQRFARTEHVTAELTGSHVQRFVATNASSAFETIKGMNKTKQQLNN
jgi:hypothetical protein